MRETALYREAESLYQLFRQPGSGCISDASELSVHGDQAVFAGVLVDRLEGSPTTRICRIDLRSGETRVLTFGPHQDRSPQFSPQGTRVAFLSDRHKSGDFQLYLLDPHSGIAQAAPPVEGWVEYLQWSPDGARILLGVAGHGADVAGGQGAITSNQHAAQPLPWMPLVQTADESYRWRQVWVYELQNQHMRRVSPSACNVWEAAWCGCEAIAAVASPGPGEGLWYSARIHLIDVASGASRELYTPADQLGWPAGAPSGRWLAFVEAVCSDRWIVAGALRILDTQSEKVEPIDTRGVDVTYTEWRSDQALLVAGHRGWETVIGVYDLNTKVFTERWASTQMTPGGRYATVAGMQEAGDCALVAEGFTQGPEIAVIRGGEYQRIRSFDQGYAERTRSAQVEQLSWQGSDGLEIQGWLLRPAHPGPYPLVMHVHGGPVWHWRPMWLGRWNVHALMLLQRGYALFFPNPRGSSGRGQDFARRVVGDMGGLDALDCLRGVDELVRRGWADPQRLGVTGASYGGFMTSWLVGQDQRFTAAVSVAPVTNQVSHHLLSNIPHFVALFLADERTRLTGRYFERSPVLHAHKVTTPTLNICGALDRCTPPEEAAQFHNALLEAGTESVLVTYPEEGHGVRHWPALMDYAARVVGWFERYMPP